MQQSKFGLPVTATGSTRNCLLTDNSVCQIDVHIGIRLLLILNKFIYTHRRALVTFYPSEIKLGAHSRLFVNDFNKGATLIQKLFLLNFVLQYSMKILKALYQALLCSQYLKNLMNVKHYKLLVCMRSHLILLIFNVSKPRYLNAFS